MDTSGSSQTSLAHGVEVIKNAVCNLSDAPGVYRMIGAGDDVLYVGKAGALAKRVRSYTQVSRLSARLQRVVASTVRMEFIQTRTEAEALLLESNLIKKLKPRYNILLRDDKSFPYIMITDGHDFPMVAKHRGAQKDKAASYFGPFASAGAVNRTIDMLQRLFKLRNCSDNVFAHRTRPCLQYHIKRCTAPCVDMVSRGQYAAQVTQARDFLNGKSRAIQEAFQTEMQAASAAQDYERAADMRDKIRILAGIVAAQDINVEGMGQVDIIGLYQADGGRSCVQVFFFRNGQNFGNRSYFPRHHAEDKPQDILSAFIAQFYENKPVPPLVLVSHDVTEAALLEEALSGRTGQRVRIQKPQRGRKVRVMDFVLDNARAALEREGKKYLAEAAHLQEVARIFGMSAPPVRIEVYDNSHISGTHMVGAMIVAGAEGLRKNAYRQFNIRAAASADDYGMMREVLSRRFRSYRADHAAGGDYNGDGSEATLSVEWPDLVLIDGGKGQLSAAREALDLCGVPHEALTLVGIAKGEDRHAGRETFFMEGRTPFDLPIDNPTLHYLQRLRDEAHRFVIGSHRARRQKAVRESPLDMIDGIGAKKKQALLYHFGSAKSVVQASVDDLLQVQGISRALARKIYDTFHDV